MFVTKIPFPGADYFTHFGAGLLAEKIERYWRAQGVATVRVERYALPGMPEVYGVRSNLIGGIPPKGGA